MHSVEVRFGGCLRRRFSKSWSAWLHSSARITDRGSAIKLLAIYLEGNSTSIIEKCRRPKQSERGISQIELSERLFRKSGCSRMNVPVWLRQAVSVKPSRDYRKHWPWIPNLT